MSTGNKTIREVLDDLATLDPVQIRNLFDRGGFKGYRRTPRACPTALYLNDQTGKPVLVTPWHVFDDEDEPDPQIIGLPESVAPDPQIIGLPESVAAFVRRFDGGEWPELDLAMAESKWRS